MYTIITIFPYVKGIVLYRSTRSQPSLIIEPGTRELLNFEEAHPRPSSRQRFDNFRKISGVRSYVDDICESKSRIFPIKIQETLFDTFNNLLFSNADSSNDELR